MSSKNVKRSFVTPLLRRLDQETRLPIQNQRGQLLLLDNTRAFKKVVEASLGRPVPDDLLQEALAVGRKKALDLQNHFRRIDKNRFNLIVERAPEVLAKHNLIIGKNAFVLASFGKSISSVKKAMVDTIFKGLDLEGDTRQAQVQYNIQKGHGEAGFAVSQVQLANTFNRASDFPGGVKALTNNFSAFLQEANVGATSADKFIHQVQQLSTQYKNVVTNSGELKAKYFSIVTFQDQGSNAADGVMEKRLITLFRKYINSTFTSEVLDLKGSSSIRDKVTSHIVHSLTDPLKDAKNIKLNLGKLDRKGSKSSGTATGKTPKNKITIKKKPKKTIRKTRAKKGSSSYPLQIMAAINKELPETVRQNMGSPKLNNQTGRFASSVRMTDVSTTQRGFLSMGYTYQKAPYQVFEMGAGSPPWATPDRDPRKIIDQSIRELAVRFALGRFYTRRT